MSESAVFLFFLCVSCLNDPVGVQEPTKRSAHQVTSERLVGLSLALISAKGFEPSSQMIRLEFAAEGKMYFNCGCNSHHGEFTIVNNQLIVHHLMGTEMYCYPPPFEGLRSPNLDEEMLSSFFLKQPTIGLQDGLLTFTSETAQLTFGDVRLVPEKPPIIGFHETVWVIDKLINSTVPLTRLTADVPAVIFHTDDRVEVNTGCNQGIGKYTVLTDSMTVHIDEFTTAVCAPKDLQEMDKFIRDLFWGPELQVKKKANRLTLSNNKTGVSAVAKIIEE